MMGWILRILKRITDFRVGPVGISLKAEDMQTEDCTSKIKKLIDLDLVKPLGKAERYILEVLVDRFYLEPDDDGTKLVVYFDDNTPAVWDNHGKEEVRRNIPDFKNKAFHFQKRIGGFFNSKKRDNTEFECSDFPFRYASGGTLPILRIGSIEYYCLFYRDIYPVGWNIANGGCDTRNELLYPHDTIERELREELIFINPKERLRYVFPSDIGKPFDRPEFELARKFWKEHLSELDVPGFQETSINIQWISGPDKVNVTMGDIKKETSGYFLNINALDFGIEVDKIAIITLDKVKEIKPSKEIKSGEEHVLFLDGEVSSNQLVNRPIGLFEVNKMNELIQKGAQKFKPDFCFFNAKCYGSDKISWVINEFSHYIEDKRDSTERNVYAETKNKFDLCPVTRNILTRYSCR